MREGGEEEVGEDVGWCEGWEVRERDDERCGRWHRMIEGLNLSERGQPKGGRRDEEVQSNNVIFKDAGNSNEYSSDRGEMCLQWSFYIIDLGVRCALVLPPHSYNRDARVALHHHALLYSFMPTARLAAITVT